MKLSLKLLINMEFFSSRLLIKDQVTHFYKKLPRYFYICNYKITVRPPKHDEYPRFIEQAYPYYFSTFATIFGLIVFIIFYLFDMDISELEKKEK